ncbi:MAG: hypothetical protein ABI444_07745 [Candidatus Kapaibacterium sp.]
MAAAVLQSPKIFAQTPLLTHEDSLKLTSTPKPDTTLATRTTPHGELFRRPTLERGGSSMKLHREGIRYFGEPITFSGLMGETGGPFPLVLTEEGYGREAFLQTNRTSEPLIATRINGALPIDDPITGNNMLNYFPMESFENSTLESGAPGIAMSGGDYASSDVVNLGIERFRAPVPFSRIHYTQILSQSVSNFEGLFSLNTSRNVNLAIGLDRRSAGSAPVQNDPTFNPRVDLWGLHGQMSFNQFLGTIHRDSTTTERQVDSILELPASKDNSVDALLWGMYTTTFSGMNGGINARDSGTDIFNSQLAPVFDASTYDHRIRIDGLFQIELPFIAHERTKLSAFATYSSRRILSPDSNFSSIVYLLAQGGRFGASLAQPLGIDIGSFLTHALIQGEFQSTKKYATTVFGTDVTDTRLSASFSDSLGINASGYGITLFGVVKGVQSAMTLGVGNTTSLFLPSIGFAGSIVLTKALGFSATYSYQKDRAALSPTPSVQYSLQNLGAFVDLRFALSRVDSIAIHAGVLDRHEPEGIVPDTAVNGLALVRFSGSDLHSQSAMISLDAYFNHIHWASNATFFPATTPLASYTTNPALQSTLTQRIFGSTAIYFENEIAEGNLRLSFGARVRYLNQLEPVLTYDPAFDYYLYRGLASRDTKALATYESRISAPKGIVDLLIATEIDRRAQVNMSFLNVLGTPYYNVGIYPRPGFSWRLDVTWAFLD